MLARLKSLWHRLLRHDEWHKATRDNEFVWRRFRPDTGDWEVRPMTEAEQRETKMLWAIR